MFSDVSANDILTAITLFTLLAIIIGDRVLGWLKTRGIDLSTISATNVVAGKIYDDTQALLRRLDDGKLEQAIISLSSNIAAQTQLLQELTVQNQLNREEHKLILEQMARDRIDKA